MMTRVGEDVFCVTSAAGAPRYAIGDMVHVGAPIAAAAAARSGREVAVFRAGAWHVDQLDPAKSSGTDAVWPVVAIVVKGAAAAV